MKHPARYRFVKPFGKDLWFWGLFFVFLAFQVWLHTRAGYAVPTPWPDESHFMWQAVGLAENNTLFSEHLNPDRTIFWLPPGYLIALGLCFKVFGVSLDVARSFSFALLLLSFFILSVLIKRHRLALVSLIIAGIVFLNISFVASGNVARPETMLIFFILIGFLFIDRQHPWKGLFLIAMTPLIHPNGFVFLGGAVIYLVLTRVFGQGLKGFTRSDLMWMLAAVVLWGLYLIYIAGNWSHFADDLAFQFQRKGERDIVSTLLSFGTIPVLIITVAAIIYRRRAGINIPVVLAFAIPAWSIQRIGMEMWYEIISGIGLICLSVIALHVAFNVAIDRKALRHRAVNYTLFTLAAILVVYWNYHSGTIKSIDQYPFRMEWWDLRFEGRVPYLSQYDRRKVTEFIESTCLEHDLKTVQFLPQADAFLLPEIVENDRIFISQPLFCKRSPDLYIIHRSRYQPIRWQLFAKNDIMATLNLSDSALFTELESLIKPFLFRDTTEAWFYCIPAKP
ncbi:MAG: hypothetical protein JSV52_01915 [Candidatus Zixiibacteriota bacterium]|nr:MAG: hypothetical protein JSV52_01915 [candidate division Zixibacteria bacterium]